MPLIIVKAIEGVFSPDRRGQLIERLTDALVSVEGERMRRSTWVLIKEVKSGDWGVGGRPVTAEAVTGEGP